MHNLKEITKAFFQKLNSKLHIIIVFACLSLFSACKNDDNTPQTDCGCVSESIGFLPPTSSGFLTGKLFFKNSSRENAYNDKKYWIVFDEEGCVNCIHNLIICNDDLLDKITDISVIDAGDIIGSVDELSTAIDVSFSGELKVICNRIVAPGDYTYNNFKLTKIEKL